MPIIAPPASGPSKDTRTRRTGKAETILGRRRAPLVRLSRNARQDQSVGFRDGNMSISSMLVAARSLLVSVGQKTAMEWIAAFLIDLHARNT
jgi:hypothetical protein